jgi:hypothetical protein
VFQNTATEYLQYKYRKEGGSETVKVQQTRRYTRSYEKNYSPTFFCYDADRIENDASNNSSLMPSYLATIRGHTDRPTASPLIRHVTHSKCRVQHSSLIASIRCRRNVFTEPLVNTDKRDILLPNRCLATIGGHTHTDTRTDDRD